MQFPIRTAPVVLLVSSLAVASAGGPAAAASTFHDASAGVDCQAANGALAAKFTYNLNFLTNTGTTDAYVVCSLPMDDENQTPAMLEGLMVDVQLGAAGSTVTCVAQTGYWGAGVNQIFRSSAQSHTSTIPNETDQLVWNAAALGRDGVATVLTLNCKLPAGAKMGLIQRWESVPVET